MSPKAVLWIERPGEPLRVSIEAWPDWEHFDRLVELLQARYSASVREACDGPDARRCVLEADGVVFELWHDDWGFNTLVATTEGAQTLVRKIGQDLERLLGSPSR